MRLAQVGLSTILLLASLPGRAGTAKSTATVSEVSPGQHFISFGGTVSLSQDTEETSPGRARTTRSEGGSVTLRNVADRGVVALALTIKTAAKQIRYNHDYFFKEHELEPGGSLDIPLDVYPSTYMETSLNGSNVPSAEPTKERADVELKFIQFDDGSTWGDKSVAESLAADRVNSEMYFRGLLGAYADQGERGFLRALETRPRLHTGALNFYTHLTRTQQTSGTEAALEEIRTRLKTAANRRATGNFQTADPVKN